MRKQPKSWLVFSALAFQIGLIMFAAVRAGDYLDTAYGFQKPYTTLFFSALALVAIIRLIIQQTKRL